MRRAALALGLSAAVGMAGAAGADPATKLIEVIGEKQSEPDGPAAGAAIKVFRQKPCGTKADAYICGRFGASFPNDPRKKSIKASNITVPAGKGDTVLVTWTGSLYCESYFVEPDPKRTEYLVYMQVQKGKISPIDVNEEGSIGVGRREVDPSERRDPTPHFNLHPVTLTRTFKASETGDANYFGVFDIELRRGVQTCNVNGGTMTAVVVR